MPLSNELSIETKEIQSIYVPLVRLILERVQSATNTKLDAPTKNLQGRAEPFILGVTGSVAVGKSSTAKIIKALLEELGFGLVVDVVSTDGFLYPNEKLAAAGLMLRKGFPESYDYLAIVNFLSTLKTSTGIHEAPLYSHTTYNVTNLKKVLKNPDIVILEGLNILQDPPQRTELNNKTAIRNSIDFSIFLDAEEIDIKNWYIKRFLDLCSSASTDPSSFFHRFNDLSRQEASLEASTIWDSINSLNLNEHILPSRWKANVILFKNESHKIETISLKKE
jgi:type I pantothenate kinase